MQLDVLLQGTRCVIPNFSMLLFLNVCRKGIYEKVRFRTLLCVVSSYSFIRLKDDCLDKQVAFSDEKR